MSSVAKGDRKQSKNEFDYIYLRIHDEAEDMIKNNFHAKGENVANNIDYIKSASDSLRVSVWDLIFHIKVANALFPTTVEELLERRIEQDKAIGICFDILTMYEMVMHKLKVKDDMGVTEIKTLRHQINAIRAWRTSDNKRFRNLRDIG